MLSVVARLHDKSKGLVWQRREYITHLNDRTQSYPVAEYFRGAEAARAAFESAAEVVVGMLLEDLSE